MNPFSLKAVLSPEKADDAVRNDEMPSYRKPGQVFILGGRLRSRAERRLSRQDSFHAKGIEQKIFGLWSVNAPERTPNLRASPPSQVLYPVLLSRPRNGDAINVEQLGNLSLASSHHHLDGLGLLLPRSLELA
jgi:hypothetical protein